MNKTTCFLSFSHEESNRKLFEEMKNFITQKPNLINYSEREDKSDFSDETIWKYLLDRISGSSCTIFLFTNDLLGINRYKIEYKKNDFLNSGWIYNELSASLRNWENNKINGVVCVLCDNIHECQGGIPKPEILTAGDNSKYIVTVEYKDFIKNPDYYIQKALDNREEQIRNKKWNIRYDLHND